MRLRNISGSREIIADSKYVIQDAENQKGKIRTYFEKDQPIQIEIGMGKGKFIIENAVMYPDINFIGIEKFDSVICKGLQKIPDGLNNLIMIRADALDIDNIFDKEIDRIYLNFSDPWPKNRHHLRRLSSKVFLNKYASLFKNDASIFMRTDNRGLFQYSLVSFSENGYILRDLSLDLHKDDMPLITTEYEDKFSNLDMPIYFVECTKDMSKSRK